MVFDRKIKLFWKKYLNDEKYVNFIGKNSKLQPLKLPLKLNVKINLILYWPSLPNAYDGVVTAIETLLENKISLNYVKTRLLEYEIKLNKESTDTISKALSVES